MCGEADAGHGHVTRRVGGSWCGEPAGMGADDRQGRVTKEDGGPADLGVRVLPQCSLCLSLSLLCLALSLSLSLSLTHTHTHARTHTPSLHSTHCTGGGENAAGS